MSSALELPTVRTYTPVKWLVWGVNALLCVVVALISYRYLFGIGPSAPIIELNTLKNPWLSIHVLGGATALLLSPFQFVRRLRIGYPKTHRWVGRIYVAGCIIGGIAGMVLAFGLSTGPVASAGFGLLSIASIFTTAVAWRAALNRDFAAHRAWMIRSFSLTYAAVALRLYIPIVLAMPIPFEDGYRAIAFLCWVPNLLLAELYLLYRPRPQ